MTTPSNYAHITVPVKYFLSSYRALTDGKSGIAFLENHLATQFNLLSEWKVVWIGVCSVLRSAVTLFQVDAKSCINDKIREEIAAEWKSISSDKGNHPIFWEFLWQERNNILHQYEWKAYEAWMHDDGTIDASPHGLLSIKPEDVKNVLPMRGGHYDGRNSLDLLRESADWVEERIISAIMRAGFDPEERRSLGSFTPAPQARSFPRSCGGRDVTDFARRSAAERRRKLRLIYLYASVANQIGTPVLIEVRLPVKNPFLSNRSAGSSPAAGTSSSSKSPHRKHGSISRFQKLRTSEESRRLSSCRKRMRFDAV